MHYIVRIKLKYSLDLQYGLDFKDDAYVISCRLFQVGLITMNAVFNYICRNNIAASGIQVSA